MAATHVSPKHISLLALTFQNATLVLWMRYVRTREGDMFLSTTAVIMAELFKFLVSLSIILYQEGGVKQWLSHLYENIILNSWDNVKIAVTSLAFVFQNILQYVAVSNLDVSSYLVSYQLKILTIALFSVVMLQRKLSAIQWGSLVMLMAGVAAVRFQPEKEDAKDVHQNAFVGMAAVIISCLMSGFVGAYFEKILKHSPQSVWLRNVQLGFSGTILGSITLLIRDGSKVSENGFFFGYDWAVWIVIMLQSFGGLLVAVVVKHADNILKGFATSAAIVISFIASMYFFNFQLSVQFVIGAVLVLSSVYLYGKYPYVAPLIGDNPQINDDIKV